MVEECLVNLGPIGERDSENCSGEFKRLDLIVHAHEMASLYPLFVSFAKNATLYLVYFDRTLRASRRVPLTASRPSNRVGHGGFHPTLQGTIGGPFLQTHTGPHLRD